MANTLRVGVGTFRTFYGPLSGTLHVVGGPPRRRRARRRANPANRSSLRTFAGSVDERGPADGESAPPPAHAAGPESYADPAESLGQAGERAPVSETLPPTNEGGPGDPPPPPPVTKRDLPRDPFEFACQVNQEEQLVPTTVGMLRKNDEKVAPKILQQLLNLAYGKTGRTKTLKPRVYINDLPQPLRD